MCGRQWERCRRFFGGQALPQGGAAVGDLVGGQVFDLSGYGPLVAVGICDAGEAVALDLVGGLGGGGDAGGHRLDHFSYQNFPAKSSPFRLLRPTKTPRYL